MGEGVGGNTERLGKLFKRSEPRQRSLAYLKGLLSAVERKNSWQLAEWMGETIPDGVQRQYSGTAGRIENSQIGVFLCYAGAGGSAFIDRELYIPRQWMNDRSRCEAAGMAQEVEFATKPQLARKMIERALEAGVPCGWVAGDEVYGGDRHLQVWLESRVQAFVLALAGNEPLWWQGPQYVKAEEIAQTVPAGTCMASSVSRGRGQRRAFVRLGAGAAVAAAIDTAGASLRTLPAGTAQPG